MTHTLQALAGQRALVVGLGQSGQAATHLLVRLGAHVVAYDRRPPQCELPDTVEVHGGDPQPPAQALRGLDLAVLSPGVPPEPVRQAITHHSPGARVTGELNLALQQYMAHPRTWAPVPLILVTGTNGKSTVTRLIEHLLRAGGKKPFAGGNLGIPLSAHMLATLDGRATWPDHLVLECSSFQLETLDPVDPVPTAVAMVLNVAPDHSDRYPSLETYARTKARVFTGIGDTGLAMASDDDGFIPAYRHVLGRRPLTLVARPLPSADPHAHAEHGDDATSGPVLRVGDHAYPRHLLPLAGSHNAHNALFALHAAHHVGVEPDACAAGLRSFPGLPHRMQRVAVIDDVHYFNDSKATNVASTVAGLQGFSRPFVLIVGGRWKGDALEPLRRTLEHGCRALVAMGESREQLVDIGPPTVPRVAVEDMTAAVRQAHGYAKPGDAVILSPACASYDAFANYAERGQRFVETVAALPGERGTMPHGPSSEPQ